jgi:hypothetical protein
MDRQGVVMDLLRLGWAFAFAGAAIGVFELYYFSGGYEPRQWLPIALWAGLPMPLTAWLGGKLAGTPQAQRILAMGLGVGLALGLFGLWDVTLGPGRNESLSGLVVITMPAYQIALLAPTLMAMWLVRRRELSVSASDGPRGPGGGRA